MLAEWKGTADANQEAGATPRQAPRQLVQSPDDHCDYHYHAVRAAPATTPLLPGVPHFLTLVCHAVRLVLGALPLLAVQLVVVLVLVAVLVDTDDASAYAQAALGQGHEAAADEERNQERDGREAREDGQTHVSTAATATTGATGPAVGSRCRATRWCNLNDGVTCPGASTRAWADSRGTDANASATGTARFGLPCLATNTAIGCLSRRGHNVDGDDSASGSCIASRAWNRFMVILWHLGYGKTRGCSLSLTRRGRRTLCGITHSTHESGGSHLPV